MSFLKEERTWSPHLAAFFEKNVTRDSLHFPHETYFQLPRYEKKQSRKEQTVVTSLILGWNSVSCCLATSFALPSEILHALRIQKVNKNTKKIKNLHERFPWLFDKFAVLTLFITLGWLLSRKLTSFGML